MKLSGLVLTKQSPSEGGTRPLKGATLFHPIHSATIARGIDGKIQNHVDGMVMTNTQQHYSLKNGIFINIYFGLHSS